MKSGVIHSGLLSETEGLRGSEFAFRGFLGVAAAFRNEMQIILIDSQSQCFSNSMNRCYA